MNDMNFSIHQRDTLPSRNMDLGHKQQLNNTNASITKDCEYDEPLLVLTHFAGRTEMDYGNVSVGETAVMNFRVKNISKRSEELSIEKLPLKQGFETSEVLFSIPPESTSVLIPVRWSPTSAGPVRASILLVWNSLKGKIRLSVIVRGRAIDKSMNASSLLNSTSLRRGQKIYTQASSESKPIKKTIPKPKGVQMMVIGEGNDNRDALTSINLNIHANHLSIIQGKGKKVAKTKKQVAPLYNKSNSSTFGTQADTTQAIADKLEKKKQDLEKKILFEEERRKRMKWIRTLPVNLDEIEEEIKYIQDNYQNKCTSDGRRSSSEGLQRAFAYFNSDKIQLLLQWVQSVCAVYGVSVENFRLQFQGEGQKENIVKLMNNFYNPYPLAFEEVIPDGATRNKLLGNSMEEEEEEEGDINMLESLKQGGRAFAVDISQFISRGNNSFTVQKQKHDDETSPDEYETINHFAHLSSKLIAMKKEFIIQCGVVAVQSQCRFVLHEFQILKMKASISRIQSQIRRLCAIREIQLKYKSLQDIQRLTRGILTRNDWTQIAKVITGIQSQMRGVLSEKVFEECRKKADDIHALSKKYKTLNEYRNDVKRMEYAYSIVVQSIYRSAVQEKRCARQIMKRDKLTSALQTMLRGGVRRDSYGRKLSVVMEMQSLDRCKNSYLKVDRIRNSATQSQAINKSRRMIRSLNKILTSSTVTQSVMRGEASKRRMSSQRKITSNSQQQLRTLDMVDEFYLIKCKTETLQSVMRSQKDHQKMCQMSLASTKIQIAFWDFMERKREAILRLHYSAVDMQSFCRASSSMFSLQMVQSRCNKLQCLSRTEKLENLIHFDKIAGTCTNSLYKSELHIFELIGLRYATTVCNSYIMSQASHENFLKQYSCNLDLQAFCRRANPQHKYMHSQNASIEIQKRITSDIASKEMTYLKDAAMKCQEIAHMNIQMSNYFLETAEIRLQKKSALIIQRIYRGYFVRKKNVDKINEISKRIAILNATVDERKKLGNRTRAALQILLNSKQISKVMKACESLETTTRYSVKCCESLVSQGAVPILFSLIKSCNRSAPHLQLLQHCLSILVHLSRSAYTAGAVFEAPESVVILVEQIQVYRDKEEIFMRALTILRRQCELSHSRLKKLKSMTSVVQRLRSIAKIMENKYKVEKNLQQSSHLKKTPRMNAATSMMINGSSLLNRKGRTFNSSLITCYEALVSFMHLLT